MGSLIFLINGTLFLLWSTHLKPTHSSTDVLPWTASAVDLLQTVCPQARICELEPSLGGIISSCCKSCSCKEDCSATSKCCFPRNTKSEDETCMFPRSRFTNTFVQSTSETLVNAYYIVTKRPADGCVDGSSSACENVSVTTLSPVYSRNTARIYRNHACAVCHGAGDLVEWEGALVCDPLGGAKPVDFQREITNYLRNRSTSTCFLTYFADTSMKAHRRSCHIPFVNSLGTNRSNDVNDDIVDPRFDMSIRDILDACESGFSAPMKSDDKWYPNPFCFIYDVRMVREPFCFRRSDNILGVEYMTLLNPRIKEVLQSGDMKPFTDMGLACMENISENTTVEFQRCRQVICPFGHILARDGRCVFIGRTVYLNSKTSFYVHILLQQSNHDAAHTTHVPTNNLLNFDDINDALQLPTEWILSTFGISSDVNGTNTGNDILIRLHPVIKNSTNMLDTLKQHLSLPIVIGKGSSRRVYTQSFYPLSLVFNSGKNDKVAQCSHETYGVLNTDDWGRISKKDSIVQDPVPDGSTNFQDSSSDAHKHNDQVSTSGPNDNVNTHPFNMDTMCFDISSDPNIAMNSQASASDRNITRSQVSNSDISDQRTLTTSLDNEGKHVVTKVMKGARNVPTCWKVLYADFRINTPAIQITKLYFCDTIELMTGEFQLMANNSVLFYKLRHIFLYTNEFIVLDNGAENKTVKICIEDAGFARMPSCGGAIKAGLVVAFSGLFIVVHVQSFLTYCTIWDLI